ncbi:MAG: formylglycine-generating enzyme family protein [Verrucomicrobiales bacterium]|nr:formylglycine-generating enzyme family protein [Verrucomicrobiales bacterium]
MTVTLPEMTRLPGGKTWIGGSPDDKYANAGEPSGSWVRGPEAFEMSRFPVTVGDWHQYEANRFLSMDPKLPAHGISWNEAMGFVNWLRETSGEKGWDLPTELEWEHAARAGTNTVFPGGDVLETDDANFLFNESIERIGPGCLTPVDHFPPSSFGLFDLLGNVCEWTLGKGPRPGERKIRGGAWDYLPRLLRCSWSDSVVETSCRENIGFRLVRRPGITPDRQW